MTNYETEWTQDPKLKNIISKNNYVIWHSAIDEINKKRTPEKMVKPLPEKLTYEVINRTINKCIMYKTRDDKCCIFFRFIDNNDEEWCARRPKKSINTPVVKIYEDRYNKGRKPRRQTGVESNIEFNYMNDISDKYTINKNIIIIDFLVNHLRINDDDNTIILSSVDNEIPLLIYTDFPAYTNPKNKNYPPDNALTISYLNEYLNKIFDKAFHNLLSTDFDTYAYIKTEDIDLNIEKYKKLEEEEMNNASVEPPTEQNIPGGRKTNRRRKTNKRRKINRRRKSNKRRKSIRRK